MGDSGWIEGPALEALLPHRGMNLLIDAVRLPGTQSGTGGAGRKLPDGEGTLQVSPGDPRGRDIFLCRRAPAPAGRLRHLPAAAGAQDAPVVSLSNGRREASGSAGDLAGYAVMEQALAEHLALGASCVLADELSPGEIALFSRISKFELHREPAVPHHDRGERLLSEVKRLRDKGNFRRFEGIVRGEGGDTVATAEIMAYAADPRETAKRDSAKLALPPEVREARPVDRGLFAWKRPEMVFVDELVDLAEDGAQGTFRYTYRAEHPFCPGHFPGNPIMMGITQWIGACDAAAWLVHERLSAGGAGGDSAPELPSFGRWRADAEILRGSGAIVAEVQGLVFSSLSSLGSGAGAASEIPPLRVESTQRVGFRGLVRAGETIFVRVRVAPC